MKSSLNEALASEVAYVKALAEEGRNAPLVGGILYVIWGVLMGLAALGSYASATGAITVPFVGGLWFWISAFTLGWLASFILGGKSLSKPGALTVGNKTARALWISVGVFMSIFWIAAMIFQSRLNAAGFESRFLFGLMFPLAFGLYGIAFFATAVAARLHWMGGFAASSWLFSVTSFYFIGDTTQFIVGAAGSFVCAVFPGLLLMRREPSEIV
ncbi:MAG: hypothetical protein U5J99_11220 [Parvularculaceae bacterium]|nr:hypothetical protein [Parvularculaceae bacterium]